MGSMLKQFCLCSTMCRITIIKFPTVVNCFDDLPYILCIYDIVLASHNEELVDIFFFNLLKEVLAFNTLWHPTLRKHFVNNGTVNFCCCAFNLSSHPSYNASLKTQKWIIDISNWKHMVLYYKICVDFFYYLIQCEYIPWKLENYESSFYLKLKSPK